TFCSSCSVMEIAGSKREQGVAGEVALQAGQAGQVALEAFAGGGAGALFEVDVGDAGDSEATGGEAQLGAEGGALGGRRWPDGGVGVEQRAGDVGAEVVPAEAE